MADSSTTKSSTIEILNLYWTLMDLYKQDPAKPLVIPGTEPLDLTLVVRPVPGRTDYDIHFYRFQHREGPVAKLTGMGDYLTKTSYQTDPATRWAILDKDIVAALSHGLTQLR